MSNYEHSRSMILSYLLRVEASIISVPVSGRATFKPPLRILSFQLSFDMADRTTQFPRNKAELTQTLAPNASISSATTWTTPFLLSPSQSSLESDPRQTRRALIILNQPFTFSLLNRLWSSTCHHLCADGGANRLYDLLQQHDPNPEHHGDSDKLLQ